MQEVNEEMKMVPYKVVRDSAGAARIKVRDKEYSPPEIPGDGRRRHDNILCAGPG